METRVNQAVVGAFVLVLAAAGIAAVLWLGSGRLSRKEYGTYLAYFTESVSGLNLHAPVKYRGVAVGSVRQIALDPTNPERVRVVMEIQEGTPVKQDSVAILGVQGLTGIAYVELEGGSRESASLPSRTGEPFPVIRTGPSLMRRLDSAGMTLLADLDESTKRVNDVLDQETRTQLRGTVSDLRRVSQALARRSADLEAIVASTAELARNGARASAQLPPLLEQVDRSAGALQRMADSVSLAGQSARSALDGEALPEVGRLVGELRGTAASLGRVSRELEQDPSLLVRGRAPAAPGPGE